MQYPLVPLLLALALMGLLSLSFMFLAPLCFRDNFPAGRVLYTLAMFLQMAVGAAVWTVLSMAWAMWGNN